MAATHKCDCGKSHEYQDATYGQGNRVVVTVLNKTSSEKTEKCTVCGKEWKSYGPKNK